MSRLIDADALIKDVKDLPNCPNGYSGTYDKACIIGLIEDAPTIEERKGKWINHRNDMGHNIADCSECGEAMQWYDPDTSPNYCPNCGADMRRE